MLDLKKKKKLIPKYCKCMIMMDDHTTIWCTLMYAITTVNGWCGFTKWYVS